MDPIVRSGVYLVLGAPLLLIVSTVIGKLRPGANMKLEHKEKIDVANDNF